MCWVLGPRAAQDQELRDAAQRLRRQGYELDVRLTWEKGDGIRWAEQAVASGAEIVVAAGGDGTLHEVVNGVLRGQPDAGTAVGLLPYGTANDFARSARILSGRPAAALEHITLGRAHPLDLISAQDRDRLENPFVVANMVTAGWWTTSTTEAPKELKRLLGGGAYMLEGLSRLSDAETTELSIRGPGFSWSGKAIAIALGNGRFAGGGIPLCPNALLDDGLFELMILPAQDLQSWLPRLGDALLGGELEPLTPVLYHKLPWLELSSEQELSLNCDGERHHGRRFRFEVRPRALPAFLGSPELLSTENP